MDTTRIHFIKLNEKAQVPVYSTEFAAGADLYACVDGPVTILAGETAFIHTGIAMALSLIHI